MENIAYSERITIISKYMFVPTIYIEHDYVYSSRKAQNTDKNITETRHIF